ncbi:hypothetical protein HZ989_05430 [Brevundimonas sp. AJA228-03]|uniref:hypothetical protein n=1 Tax=Brevundimonas sp. AJA228-03 TaxID=2752515 RepID=UPI001AE0ABC1|nr:hypothetical protein [Brevundimonas sp. AJA228-03]QTN20503.1 hypothetical protein HZ989_05430 [Brevundimonas sp. AJA228-03]
MPITDDLERKIIAGGLLGLACSLGGLASALTVLALDHMAMTATLCGPTSGHCMACFGAVACWTATLGAAAAGTSLLRFNAVHGARA